MTASPQAASLIAHLRQCSASRRTRLAIIAVWAVGVAALGFHHFLAAAPPSLMPSRASEIARSIDVIDHGGPPLTISDVPYHRGIAASHLLRIPTGDDPGIYTYLPFLGHWMGQTNPERLMQWLFAGCFGLLLLLVPFVTYDLFGSVLAALAAPLLVVWKFSWAEQHDLYWIQAWALLLGLPVLLLAHAYWHRGRRRRANLLLVGIALAASFATSIRTNAGLGVAATAAALALLVGLQPYRPRTALETLRREWLVRGVALAGVVVAYLSIATFGMAAIRHYRDDKVAWGPRAVVVPESHPFWHPIFLGLGYLPNPYGITWNDTVAADFVNRTVPGVAYLSPRYESVLRRGYLDLVRRDPAFVLRTYATKAHVVIADAFHRFGWPFFLVLVVAVCERERRRRVARAALIAAPSLALSFAPAVLTIPTPDYELGWLGGWGAVWLLGLCWAIASVPRFAPAVARRLWRPTAALRRQAAVLVATSVGLALVAVWANAAGNAKTSADTFFGDNQTAFATGPVPSGRTVLTWRFSGRLPHGWRAISVQRTEPDSGQTSIPGLYVLAGMTSSRTVLQGPTRLLSAGAYAIVAHGRVLAGGESITVMDVAGQKQLAQGRYWYGQGDFVHATLTATFTLDKPTRVAVDLGNWVPHRDASAWVVWDVGLRRIGNAASGYSYASRGFYEAGATTLSPAGSARGARVASWSFRHNLPTGWETVGATHVTVGRDRTHVETTSERSTYQLLSGRLRLSSGHYLLLLSGRVDEGGLELGVLDDRRNTWIQTNHFWSGQPFGPDMVMAASVTLRDPKDVRIVLSNWAPLPHASKWQLDRLAIVRLR